MRRDTRKAYRARVRNIEDTIDQAKATLAAERVAEQEATSKAYDARTTPVPFTEERWQNARHVRTRSGWHQVVRVNAKSVTVATGYSWNDRVTRGQVLEVRA